MTPLETTLEVRSRDRVLEARLIRTPEGRRFLGLLSAHRVHAIADSTDDADLSETLRAIAESLKEASLAQV